jgi:hypothetical protein
MLHDSILNHLLKSQSKHMKQISGGQSLGEMEDTDDKGTVNGDS